MLLAMTADNGGPWQLKMTKITMIAFIAMPGSCMGISCSLRKTAMMGSTGAMAAGQSQSTGCSATMVAMLAVVAE